MPNDQHRGRSGTRVGIGRLPIVVITTVALVAATFAVLATARLRAARHAELDARTQLQVATRALAAIDDDLQRDGKISQTLVKSLLAGDPAEVLGRDGAIVAWLDRVREMADEEFADDPQSRLAAGRTLIVCYTGLGLLDDLYRETTGLAAMPTARRTERSCRDSGRPRSAPGAFERSRTPTCRRSSTRS